MSRLSTTLIDSGPAAMPAAQRPRASPAVAMLGSVLLVAAVMVAVGVGGSFTVPPTTALILDSVPHHRAGVASGVFNTFRQMGGSLGVAAFGAVVAGHASFMSGVHVSLTATAVLVVLAAGASLALRSGNESWA